MEPSPFARLRANLASVAGQLGLRRDPVTEGVHWDTHAPTQMDRRQFARRHELECLGPANAEKRSNLPAVDQEGALARFQEWLTRRRGNRMRRRFPRAPSAAPASG